MAYKIIIESGRAEKNYWKDLWHYRELFYILSWRDIKVRYKQTTLGVLWAIIRPLLTMIIFTFVFGKVAKMEVQSVVPYALIVFAGLLPWQFFSNALTESSNSLVGNERLVTKVYFPRMIIPASSVITSFIDFLISFAILLVLFVVYQYMPSARIFWMPLFWIMAFLASFGPGLYLTAMNVKYRDFRYIIPFIVQFGLFISPVGYTSAQIPEKYQAIYALNPMVGVIDGFRWCIVKDAPNPMLHYPFYISLAVIVFFLALAVYQFRKMEKNFADLI
ncbi:MAG TPA: ABC transporter permease [Chitinophagaceae bacterium]|nr:ABC transporter permease [Chitinophagaceae bacterium]HPN59558.1 ABC transporter permease [Chitinophagaceae bacterium]